MGGLFTIIGVVVVAGAVLVALHVFSNWAAERLLGDRYNPSFTTLLGLFPAPFVARFYAKHIGAMWVKDTNLLYKKTKDDDPEKEEVEERVEGWRISNVIMLLHAKGIPGRKRDFKLRYILNWFVPMWIPFLWKSFTKSKKPYAISRYFALYKAPCRGYSDEEWAVTVRERKAKALSDKLERQQRGWTKKQQIHYWEGQRDYLRWDRDCDYGPKPIGPDNEKDHEMWELGWNEAEQKERAND